MPLALLGKLFGIALLLAMSWQLYFSHDHWTFISNVNLIFHEAGHALFVFFGQFFYVLGGTIVELGVPALVAIQFWRTGQLGALGFALWWLSTALYSVGVYAQDARERALPLLTGDANSHDWHWLLRELGWLRYDDLIGGVFIFASVFVLTAALVVFSKSCIRTYHLWTHKRSRHF